TGGSNFCNSRLSGTSYMQSRAESHRSNRRLGIVNYLISDDFFAGPAVRLGMAANLRKHHKEGGRSMLYYALVFFVIAILAAILGLGGIAIAFAGIAKLLFFLFIVLFVISLVMHVGRQA